MLCSVPSFAQEVVIKDPDTVMGEINDDIAHQRSDQAFNDILKYVHTDASPQALMQQSAMKTGLAQVVVAGPALLIDKVYQRKFGNSVIISVYYFNFPRNPSVSSFPTVFVRYIFMKSPDGWNLKSVDFKQTAQFPPAGWDLP
jgi:hypothetical protein